MRVRAAMMSAAVLVAVGAVAAVTPVPADAASKKSACGVLTNAQVSTATGATASSGKPPNAPTTTAVCGYKLSDGGSVNLWVDKTASAKPAYSLAKRTFKSDAESVTGLGSNAFYTPSVRTAYGLKGNTLVYVQFLPSGSSIVDPGAGVQGKDQTGELLRDALKRV